jgi:hypothetical protein
MSDIQVYCCQIASVLSVLWTPQVTNQKVPLSVKDTTKVNTQEVVVALLMRRGIPRLLFNIGQTKVEGHKNQATPMLCLVESRATL